MVSFFDFSCTYMSLGYENLIGTSIEAVIEVVSCMYVQIAQRNLVDLDVDLALGFASHYCKIGTMECLVEDGKADSFLGPLMRAAERGCMEVGLAVITYSMCIVLF